MNYWILKKSEILLRKNEVELQKMQFELETAKTFAAIRIEKEIKLAELEIAIKQKELHE